MEDDVLDFVGIVSDSIVDEPGIHTTIFCQGCPHHCPGCQNPESWPFGVSMPMDPESADSGCTGEPEKGRRRKVCGGWGNMDDSGS